MPDPNKIEGGRWDRVLRGIFNLKGAGPTSARISDDISPTFNFPYRPEHDFLIGDQLLVGRMSSGPMANNNPRCILTNTSTNKLLIVDKAYISTDVNGTHFFGWTSAIIPFVAAIPVLGRDGRWLPLQQDRGGGASRLQEAPVGVLPTPRLVDVITNTNFQLFEVNLVLAPGDSFFSTGTVQNSSQQAVFFWREHTMEPSEVA